MRHSPRTPGPAEQRASVEQGGAASTAVELRLPARRGELGAARKCAEEQANAFGLDADSSYEFVFAVNEAVTNAIRHGAPDELGLIMLRFTSDGNRLTCSVHDSGTFIVPVVGANARSDHGRGLPLMARLVDDLRLSIKPGNTIVRLSKDRSQARIGAVAHHAGAVA
jgi:stage II sporulation protein AB (anti-sigma F factor)